MSTPTTTPTPTVTPTPTSAMPSVEVYLSAYEGDSNNVNISFYATISEPYENDLWISSTVEGIGGYTLTPEVYIPAGETVSANIGQYTSPYNYTTDASYSLFNASNVTFTDLSVWEFIGEDVNPYAINLEVHTNIDVSSPVPTATPTNTPTPSTVPPTPSASEVPATTPTNTPSVTPTRAFDVVNGTTLNEMFASASAFVDGDTLISSGSNMPSLLKYTNYGNTDVTLDLTTVEGFSGRVSIFNEFEFLRCSFQVLSGGAVIENPDKFIVQPSFFDNVYDDFSPSEPEAVTYLSNISISSEEGAVRLSSRIKTGETVYFIVDYVSSYILQAAISQDPVSSDIILVPSEPATTTPGLNEVIAVKGVGPYSFALPGEVLQNLQGTDINISIIGTTDKVVQITIKYGSYSKTSGYLYDPDAVVNLESLREEIISATGNEQVVLIPMTGAAINGGFAGAIGGMRNILDMNIVADGNAVLEVIINALIANTTFKSQIQAGPATATAFPSDDPQYFRARPDESGTSVRRRLRALGYI